MQGQLALTEPEIMTIYMGLQVLCEQTTEALGTEQLTDEARVISVDLISTAVSALTKLQKATGIKYEPMPEYEEGDEKEFIKPR